MPVIKTAQAMGGLASGQTLEVIATDPGAVKDFEAFCRTTGNELVESKEEGDLFTFVINALMLLLIYGL